MKLGMYAVYSTVAELYHQEGVFLFNTDAHAEMILSQRIGDKEKIHTEIVRVGYFDIVTGKVTPCEHIVISYKTGALIDSAPVEQSPISHDSVSVQETKFAERIADIKARE